MKPLTPQELIDLPGYGRAQKHLRDTSRWELTAEEKVIRALSQAANACYNAIEQMKEPRP